MTLTLLIYFVASLVILGLVLWGISKLPISPTLKTIINVVSIVGVLIYWIVRLVTALT